MKISIAIPVYNVEDYLRECLDAILSQTYTDLEVVCVNDGSTDSSGDIMEEYAQRDFRVKIIRQENKGLFVARKNGILQSTGQYVLCIDSDDWLDAEACEVIAWYLGEHPDTDILQYGVEAEGGKDEEKRFYSQWFTLGTHEIEGSRSMIERCYREKVVPWNVATKVIRGSIAREAYRQMPDVRFGALEDFIGCFYVMNMSHIWRGIDNRFYHYRLGTGMSTARQPSSYDAETFRKTLGYMEAFRHLLEWADANVHDETVRAIVHKDMMKVISYEPYAFLRNRMQTESIPEDFGDAIAERIGLSNAPSCLTSLLATISEESKASAELQKVQKKKQKYKRLTNLLLCLSAILFLTVLTLLMLLLAR